MGWNPFDKVKKKNPVSKVKKEIEDALDFAKREVAKEGASWNHKIAGSGNWWKGKLTKEGKHILSEVEERGQKNLARIEDRTKIAAEQVLKEMLGSLTSPALDKWIDWVELFAPSAAGLELGPLAFEVENVTERIDYFRGLAKNPPTGSADLKEVILAVAPSSVTLTLSANISLVVLNIDELGVGGWIKIETADFLAKLDKALA